MGKWSLPQGDAWVGQRNRSATEAELRDKSIADVDPDGRAMCVWEPVLSMHYAYIVSVYNIFQMPATTIRMGAAPYRAVSVEIAEDEKVSRELLN